MLNTDFGCPDGIENDRLSWKSCVKLNSVSWQTCMYGWSTLSHRLKGHAAHVQIKVIPEGVMEEDKLEAATKHGSLIDWQCIDRPQHPGVPAKASKDIVGVRTLLSTPLLTSPLYSCIRKMDTSPVTPGKDCCTGLHSGTHFSIFLRASPHLAGQYSMLL